MVISIGDLGAELRRTPRLNGALVGVGISIGSHFRGILPMGVAETAMVAAFAIYLIVAKPAWKNASLSMLLSPVAVFLSLLFSGSVSDASALYYGSLVALGTCVALAAADLHPIDAKIASKIYVAVSSAVSIIALGLLLHFIETGHRLIPGLVYGRPDYARAEGLLQGPNYFAVSLLPALVVSLVLSERERWAVLAAGVILLGIVGSLSRGGLLAAFVVLSVCFMAQWRSWKRYAVIATIVVVGIGAWAALTPAEVARETIDRRTADVGGGVETRIESIVQAKETFLQGNWFVGAGRIDYKADMGHSLHNSYLTILLDNGIIGLLSFLVVLGALGVASLRSFRDTPYPLALVLSAGAIAATNDLHLVRDWWLCLGIAWFLILQSRKGRAWQG